MFRWAFTKILTLVLLTFLLGFSSKCLAESQAPVLRMKFGYLLTTFTAGKALINEPLGDLFTIMPTVLWDLPTFRSRIGVHFEGTFMSDYGLFPIGGIGFSGYFYPLGISSAYETTDNGVLQQKSKVSPFVFGALTPTNFNINQKAESVAATATPISFSALMYETMLGVGIDYPLRQNLILFGEVVTRFGSAPEQEVQGGNVSYSSFGVMLGFMTSYY